jgi:hypothetical protein
MQKRGQVTIFIVLGIVILVVIALLFTFRSELIEQDFESEMNSIIVPHQLMPVKQYFDSCLDDVVNEGIMVLGEQGGYIEIPDDIAPRFDNNVYSNSLELYGDSEVAYWFYESANGIEKEQIPTKEDMELQLEDYVSRNFDRCFYFVDNFEEEGFEIEVPTADATVDVMINRNEVQVKVLSDVLVSLKDVNKILDKHMIVVDSKLGELYEIALKIMKEENKEMFLEEKTIDMMVAYDAIPFSTTEFTCERKLWQKGEVVEDMKEIVSTNVAALRLKDLSGSAFLPGNTDYFEIDVEKPSYVSDTFIYSTEWPMVVDVSPTRGEILVGDPLTQQVPEISKFLNLFFCLNNYHFVYDVKYPVLISLADQEGFNFQFATMVKIDNNQPRAFNEEILNYESANDLTEDICDKAVKPTEIAVYDNENFADVGGASVLYKCFSSTCYIGETNEQGILQANFPPCLNGLVIAQKEGYEVGGEIFSSNVGESTSVLLDKHQELDLNIRAVRLSDGYTSDVGLQQAIVQFENLDNGYITMATHEDEFVKLTNGDYLITTYLMTEAGEEIELGSDSTLQCVTVPKSGVLGLFLNEEKCFESEYDGGVLEDVISGGAIFSWKVERISDKKGLTIYVPYEKVPRTQNEMLEVFNNININKDSINFRYPEIK